MPRKQRLSHYTPIPGLKVVRHHGPPSDEPETMLSLHFDSPARPVVTGGRNSHTTGKGATGGNGMRKKRSYKKSAREKKELRHEMRRQKKERSKGRVPHSIGGEKEHGGGDKNDGVTSCVVGRKVEDDGRGNDNKLPSCELKGLDVDNDDDSEAISSPEEKVDTKMDVGDDEGSENSDGSQPLDDDDDEKSRDDSDATVALEEEEEELGGGNGGGGFSAEDEDRSIVHQAKTDVQYPPCSKTQRSDDDNSLCTEKLLAEGMNNDNGGNGNIHSGAEGSNEESDDSGSESEDSALVQKKLFPSTAKKGNASSNKKRRVIQDDDDEEEAEESEEENMSVANSESKKERGEVSATNTGTRRSKRLDQRTNDENIIFAGKNADEDTDEDSENEFTATFTAASENDGRSEKGGRSQGKRGGKEDGGKRSKRTTAGANDEEDAPTTSRRSKNPPKSRKGTMGKKKKFDEDDANYADDEDSDNEGYASTSAARRGGTKRGGKNEEVSQKKKAKRANAGADDEGDGIFDGTETNKATSLPKRKKFVAKDPKTVLAEAEAKIALQEEEAANKKKANSSKAKAKSKPKKNGTTKAKGRLPQKKKKQDELDFDSDEEEDTDVPSDDDASDYEPTQREGRVAKEAAKYAVVPKRRASSRIKQCQEKKKEDLMEVEAEEADGDEAPPVVANDKGATPVVARGRRRKKAATASGQTTAKRSSGKGASKGFDIEEEEVPTAEISAAKNGRGKKSKASKSKTTDNGKKGKRKPSLDAEESIPAEAAKNDRGKKKARHSKMGEGKKEKSKALNEEEYAAEVAAAKKGRGGTKKKAKSSKVDRGNEEEDIDDESVLEGYGNAGGSGGFEVEYHQDEEDGGSVQHDRTMLPFTQAPTFTQASQFMQQSMSSSTAEGGGGGDNLPPVKEDMQQLEKGKGAKKKGVESIELNTRAIHSKMQFAAEQSADNDDTEWKASGIDEAGLEKSANAKKKVGSFSGSNGKKFASIELDTRDIGKDPDALLAALKTQPQTQMSRSQQEMSSTVSPEDTKGASTAVSGGGGTSGDDRTAAEGPTTTVNMPESEYRAKLERLAYHQSEAAKIRKELGSAVVNNA